MRTLFSPARLLLIAAAAGAAACSSAPTHHTTAHHPPVVATADAELIAEDPLNRASPIIPTATGYDGFTAALANIPGTTAGANGEGPRYEHPENTRQVSFASEGADFDPVVSADGQKIYFSSTRHRPTSDIYVQNINGTAVTQLTSDPGQDVMPAVSPDGSRIAFASDRGGNWDIYIINADGGQAVQVTSDLGHEMHPTWSPDGTKLAYCRLGTTSDRWEVWLRDLNKPNAITFLTYGLFPDWHPTANEILFQRPRERGSRLFSIWKVQYVEGEATQPTEIVSSAIAAIINPTWSADGNHVAFSVVANPPDGAVRPTSGDVWIARADGTARTNLTKGRDLNLMPAWAPDGSVYFISNRSGFDSVWSIRPEHAIQAAAVTPMPGEAPHGSHNTDLAEVEDHHDDDHGHGH